MCRCLGQILLWKMLRTERWRRLRSSYPSVDDTCTAVHRDKVQHLLQHLNSIEGTIQFTVEMESEGILPSLNVKLHHEPDGSISTSVYRKATHTDKYLDFSSHHPLPHKRAVISTLLNRAKTYSSWSDARNSEEDHISLALQWNGYPRKLICKHSPSSLTGASTPTAEPPEWKTTTVLPYVRGVSEPLRRILAPLKVRVCFKPCWTLRNLLSRPKAPIPDLQKSSVVYKIPCTHCSASYIGQTFRRLCQRLEEQQ